MSDVAEVLERVVLDELDFDAPCQHSAAAGEPADWALKCRACGGIAVMLCSDHLAVVRRNEADVIADAAARNMFPWTRARAAFGHSVCGFAADTIDAAFEVVPVR